MSTGLDVTVRSLGHAQRAWLGELQLRIPPGAILTLMGPSGCGKTSLLHAIAGTLSWVAEGVQALQFEGEVWLNGQRVDGLAPHLRQIGLLGQEPLLLPHWTVAENLAWALPRPMRPQAPTLVQQALQAADLAGLGPCDPHTLSGGQQARVALLRSLLAQPRALLLDEPFSRLDAPLRQQMRQWVFAQIRARQIPALLVTHDPADIADPARVLHLGARAGDIGPGHA